LICGLRGRRGRWHEILSQFDLTIEYFPGKDNIVADAMPKFAYPATSAIQDTHAMVMLLLKMMMRSTFPGNRGRPGT